VADPTFRCSTCGQWQHFPIPEKHLALCADHAYRTVVGSKAKEKTPAISLSALLYTPLPLDAVGLQILAELRRIQGGSRWKRLVRVRSLSYAMGILGQASWADEFRDMRGYVEVRVIDGERRRYVEFRLTGIGDAELDRAAL
jgi:hypothetical protein